MSHVITHHGIGRAFVVPKIKLIQLTTSKSGNLNLFWLSASVGP